MGKKNQEKKVMKEVQEILDTAVVTTEETLLDESLAIDMDKLSNDLEEMKKEIFEEKEDVETVNEEPKEVKVEETKTTKKLNFRSFGAYWNGQDFGY